MWSNQFSGGNREEKTCTETRIDQESARMRADRTSVRARGCGMIMKSDEAREQV